ncbi:gluconate 2-dehydrogenase subunit 3 family protein [Pseudoalteromonas fenneropenaei]|uniref:Gluconate 2-dehydrogenase subunit 3 family protein n=1 Tax=Pseudoalteromonas fenneropenaei TaxID=1737459 RepID=A0ABV7CGC6_9GAMM
MHQATHKYQYRSGMTRRESLKWLGLLAAGSAVSLTTGCGSAVEVLSDSSAHWPELDLKPINAKGYGTDPNMVIPPESPWPLTMTTAQLTMVALLSDIIVPREGQIPSASEVKVPEVIDEWVSAPYSDQQRDRVTILSILAWIDDEALLRFKKTFVALTASERLAIIQDIAYVRKETPEAFHRPAKAFDRLKQLVLSAFFCSPEGCKDIGYLGNVPIVGDYPGPSAEAQAHLDAVLAELGLSQYAYPGN